MAQPGKIVDGGMGGLLNPPMHPECSYHVEYDLRKRKENRSAMSLSQAVLEDPYLNDAIRALAQALLDNWEEHKLLIESEQIQDWIHQVLGYFRGCYKGHPSMNDPESAWNASNLQTSAKVVPMQSIDAHAGVHHIRQYYPDFTPTQEDFDKAYWGSQAGGVAKEWE